MTQCFMYPGDQFDTWTLSAFADMERLFNTANIKFPLSNLLIEKETGTMIIELALAGYNQSGFELSVEDNSIVLEGKAHKRDDSCKVIYQDIKQSAFKQRIPISSKFDLSKIEANFSDGILTIRVPVSEERKPKKIEIKK